MALSQGCSPDYPYFGLYTDETHTASCVDVEWPLIHVEMWACALASANGIACIEFAISYPTDPNIIPDDVTLHPDIYMLIGDFESGAGACFTQCQYDWTWVFHQTFIILPGALPAWVEIMPHPELGSVNVGNCEPGG